MVHKGDKKSFPATVQRCQECRQSFTDADLVAVKTTAPREFTDSQGKKRKVVSNIYLHYLTTCLKAFKQGFDFTNIRIPKSTQALLPAAALERIKQKGCIAE